MSEDNPIPDELAGMIAVQIGISQDRKRVQLGFPIDRFRGADCGGKPYLYTAFPIEVAKAVGQALIDCAEDAESGKSQNEAPQIRIVNSKPPLGRKERLD